MKASVLNYKFQTEERKMQAKKKKKILQCKHVNMIQNGTEIIGRDNKNKWQVQKFSARWFGS